MKIRVAMIIQAYYPHLGGAESQLMALIPLLQKRGVEVNIITRRYAGLKPFEIIDSAPVYRLRVPGPKAMASLSFTAMAIPLLLKLRPDVIHAHELLSPTTTAVIAKQLFSIPVVAKVLRGGVLGDLAKLHRTSSGQWRMKVFQRQVNTFITISREIDKELAMIGVPSERRLFIPNGVNAKRFMPVTHAEKLCLRKQLYLPKGPIVVYSGRLAAEKRIDQLIKIWPEIRLSHPEATLLLVGSGNEAAYLKSISGDGVLFAGHTDNVLPYLQSADLFVLPSTTEGLSNALLEALATGLAAVATNVGGTTDVIQHGHNGWLIEPDQPRQLSQALLALLADENHRNRLGRNGRAVIMKNYLLTTTADQISCLYQQLIESHAELEHA